MGRKSERKKYTITIGIEGIEEKVGVTHLTIMLANYLASKEQYKVAVLDMSSGHSIAVLQALFEDRAGQACAGGEGNSCFRMHKVAYYSRVTSKDIATILQEGYQYVLMDFGVPDSDRCREESRRCHWRILVGSCCEWQQASFRKVLKEHKEQNVNSWNYVSFLGIESVRAQLEKEFRIQIHKIPFEEDPFLLHRTHFEQFRCLLREVLACR